MSSGVSWLVSAALVGSGASLFSAARTGTGSPRSGSFASGTATAPLPSSDEPPVSITPTPMPPAMSSRTRPMTPIARRRRNRPVFAVTIVEPLDAMVPTPK